MSSCGYFDEDRMAEIKEEWSAHCGIMPTYCARRGSIMDVQSFFNESNGPDFSE